MRYRNHAKLVARRARILAPLIALPLAVGCGVGDVLNGAPAENAAHDSSHHEASGETVAQTAKVYSMAELAKAIGCGKPTVQIDAADVKQGYCNVKKQRYFLSTFPSKEGMNVWAAEEQGWGSVLVGNKWAIGVAPETLLPGLQEKLGGSIQGEHAMAGDGAMEQSTSQSGGSGTADAGGSGY